MLQAVGAFLEQKVDSMVDEATRRQARGPEAAGKPLVRLRVDYTGCSTINSQRFSQKFVGKVANPHDVLHWHKAAAKRQKVQHCFRDAPRLLSSRAFTRLLFLELQCAIGMKKHFS